MNQNLLKIPVNTISTSLNVPIKIDKNIKMPIPKVIISPWSKKIENIEKY